jgi:hypothetical protein
VVGAILLIMIASVFVFRLFLGLWDFVKAELNRFPLGEMSEKAPRYYLGSIGSCLVQPLVLDCCSVVPS